MRKYHHYASNALQACMWDWFKTLLVLNLFIPSCLWNHIITESFNLEENSKIIKFNY